MDLPTIIESQKTIDRKTFYKTADISQMVVCQEGEPSDEEDAPVKPKKYDPNKVTTFAYSSSILHLGSQQYLADFKSGTPMHDDF